jgi:hypothetical protein
VLVLRKSVVTVVLSLAAIAVGAAAADARDTSIKVILEGQHWFCHTDPTGWPLADFKAVCSLIDAGGKGEFVEFIVDRKGKVRRKPQSPKKADPKPPLRGSLA